MKYIAILLILFASISFTNCDNDICNNCYNDKYHLSIRDIGPAGGLIFYINSNADKDGWKYLEAAPSETEWADKRWGMRGGLVDCILTTIGDGKSNTNEIVSWLDNNTDDTYGDVSNKTDRAAYLCYELEYNGFSDWFLPSRDELAKMYENCLCSGFVCENNDGSLYWSSSEVNANASWVIHYLNGYQYGNDKDSLRRVRAIRSF